MSAAVASAFLAEIHSSGELTHAHEVGALDKLPLQRRLVNQGGESLHRPQVCVEPELLAHREQTLLRPDPGCGVIVVAGVADRSEEDRVAFEADAVGLLGKGVAVSVNRAGAHACVSVLDFMSESCADGVYGLHRLGHDLGADSVPRKLCYPEFHFSS